MYGRCTGDVRALDVLRRGNWRGVYGDVSLDLLVRCGFVCLCRPDEMYLFVVILLGARVVLVTSRLLIVLML